MPSSVPAATTAQAPPSTLQAALNSACRGGVAGGIAMLANISTLMWLRTTVNYQYRHGTTMQESFRLLYRDGGIPRFYRGVLPVLVQGPLSRFGDTAANAGVLSLLNSTEQTREWPVAVKTGVASLAASSFRIGLMPIDVCKINLQVSGSLQPVWAKYHAVGIRTFFQGSIAAASATFAGHYPWFFTYNYLDATVPDAQTPLAELSRRALLGFSASVVSDTTSNSIRVMKVYKQSHATSMRYPEIARQIIQEQGLRGLLFRGLETKILSNGLQGIMFSILWKSIEKRLS